MKNEFERDAQCFNWRLKPNLRRVFLSVAEKSTSLSKSRVNVLFPVHSFHTHKQTVAYVQNSESIQLVVKHRVTRVNLVIRH